MIPLALDTLVAQLVNGLVLGMLIALIAMGLSLIFGLMNVINFAHGAFYALGAYLGYTFLYILGTNFWVALLLTPFIIGFIGMSVERTLFRKIYNLPHYFQLFLSFGLVLAITAIIRIIYGVLGKPFTKPDELQFIFDFGLFTFPSYRIFVLVFTVILTFCVWILLQKTELGLIIRAGIDDREMIEGVGINISNVYTFTFALGTAIAGLSGVIGGPLVALHPEMGMDIMDEVWSASTQGSLSNSFPGVFFSSTLCVPQTFSGSRRSPVPPLLSF